MFKNLFKFSDCFWGKSWSNCAKIELICIALPLLMVLFSSFLFLFGISIHAWEGWLVILGVFYLFGKLDKEHAVRNLLIMTAIMAIAVFCSAIFIFVDSYDVTICHRPAIVMLANGWNPVWDSTIESVQRTGWDFSGISLKHILFQPRSIWLYGAVAYSMSGIPNSDISLFVLFAVSLFLYARKFSVYFYHIPTFMGIIFSLTLLAIPQIAQAITGQIDYIIYASTLIAVFALFLFIHTRDRGDLVGGCAALLWLLTGKINGMLFAAFIGIFMLVFYFYTEKQIASEKIKKAGYAVAILVFLMLVITWNPFVTSSIHYGSPFYPAHSFVQKYQQKNADLTNDFIGNADSEKMGHIGRWIYAWGCKSLTLKYYRLKTGNPDFYPLFKVAEGCEGYKNIFRIAMLIGTFLWIFSKKRRGDWVILVLFACSFLLPTKYIGYSRYSQCIWAVPFIMLISFYSSLRFQKNYKNSLLKYCVSFFLFCYMALVMGRFSLVLIHHLYRSEQAWKIISELKPRDRISVIISQPEPTWKNTSVRSLYPGSPMTLKVQLQALIPSGLFAQLDIDGKSCLFQVPLKRNHYLFLLQHRFFLKNGTLQEFVENEEIKLPTSVSTMKMLPYQSIAKCFPSYLCDILFRRSALFFEKLKI